MIKPNPTKGWIKHNDSGNKFSFQYNPTTLSYSRGASYADISAPGMAYPETQFVKGNVRSFPVTLFLYDNPSTGVIKKQLNLFEGLLTPEVNSKDYKKPSTFTFCLGFFVRKCVLEDMSVDIERFDKEGNPIQATVTLQLRQVGK